MSNHPVLSTLDRYRRNILGDTEGDSDRELERQRTIAMGICLIGAAALTAFGSVAALAGNAMLALVDFVVASLLLGLLWHLRNQGTQWRRTIRSGIAISGALFFFLFATGGASGTGYLWYFVFPLVACALLGSARGLRATLVLITASIALLMLRGVFPEVYDYSPTFLARFLGSMIVVTLFSYLTELTRERAQERLAETNDSLESAVENLLETQKRLQESEAEHRHLVEQASDGIALVEEGRLRFVNPRMAEIVGLPIEKSLGKPFQVFIHPDERSRVESMYRKRMAGERVPSTYETRLLHRDGREITVEIHARRAVHDGRAGDLVLVRDITERKQVESAILAARRSAEAANQAKSQFLANMSHEIRTPMHGVLGMADLLQSTDLDTKQMRFVDTIQSSANNLLQLINGILDFSRIESGQVILADLEFDLRALIEETVELLSEEAYRKDLEMAYWIDPDVPRDVMGDPHRLRQVLLNLIGNAVKFTDEGEVVVHVRRASRAANQDALEFEIRDTGIGVSSAVRSQIFEEFTQGDGTSAREHGGSGLGLAISRRIVQLMGGDLELARSSDEGSVFQFTAHLPTAPDGASPAIDDRLLESVRILLADPSPTWQRILDRYLSHRGASVEYADTGRDALRAIDLATAAGEPFHLVLVEQRLPHGSASELARLIQQNSDLVGPRVIAMAPWFQACDPLPMDDLDLAGSLSKPVSEPELEECILRALGRQTDPQRTGEPESQAEPEPYQFSGRVLLAEDNLVNQQVAIEMLRSMGFEVELAEDGLQALAMASREPFDLILMDCQMPKMDGFESTRAIRKHESDFRGEFSHGRAQRLPIVALTANASKEARGQCLDAGMDDYLSKPFDQAQLVQVVARWLPKGRPERVPRDSSTTDWGPVSDIASRRAS